MKEVIYLDYNASTPLRDCVKDAMIESFQDFGNPSSIHTYGRKARARIESARDILAHKLGVLPAQIVFTSGGTEANNFSLQAAINKGYEIYVSAIEHESVIRTAPKAKIISITPEGIIDLNDLEQQLAKSPIGSAFVSVMLANNETGICQPVKEISDIVKRYQGRLHCDAVTAFTKIPFTYKDLRADYVSISSHKIGGPKGIGALIVRADEQLPSILHGGGQEKGHRAGTENITGIVGFAQAIEDSADDPWVQICEMRDFLEDLIHKKHPEVPIYGKKVKRLPNTSSIGMPGVETIKQLLALDLEGFAVSSGSACSSGKITPSHVLKAMGVADDQAQQAIRVSLGWMTTKTDVEQFAEAWSALYQRFQN